MNSELRLLKNVSGKSVNCRYFIGNFIDCCTGRYYKVF